MKYEHPRFMVQENCFVPEPRARGVHMAHILDRAKADRPYMYYLHMHSTASLCVLFTLSFSIPSLDSFTYPLLRVLVVDPPPRLPPPPSSHA